MTALQKSASPAVGRRAIPGFPDAWTPLASAIVLMLAHLPLLALQARLTWDSPHYRFFPLIPIGAAWLAVRAGRELGPLEPGQGRPAAWLLGGCWALLATACLMGSAWLAAIAALGTTAAAIYAIGGGGQLLRPLLPAWGLLLLAIPPPLNLDDRLIGWLQAAVSRMSSSVLDLLGVFHLRQGNVIRLADRPLLIEEACSGIHSLFAVLAGMIFLALYCRRSLARGLGLVVVAVGWVLVGNILRIVTVVYLAWAWKIDVASGWTHEALGLAVFAIALGLTVSTDNLFSFLADLRGSPEVYAEDLIHEPGSEPPAPRLGPGPDHPTATPTRLPDLRRTALASWRLAGAYGALLLAEPFLIGGLIQDYFVPASALASRVLALRADDLPASWEGGFQQQESRAVERELVHGSGRYSRLWTYRWGRRTVTVSLDGPFQGWHELTKCYLGNGWTTLDRTIQPGEGRGGAFALARLERPPALSGELLFSLFDDRGNVMNPGPFGGRLGYVTEHLSFWRRPLGHWTYQVQVLVDGGTSLTPAERDQATAFFQDVRARLIQRIGPGGREGSS